MFQTKDILSAEVFRRFWIQITEDQTQLMIEVGRDEESTAFMSRTWFVGSEPIPWSDISYVGFSSYFSLTEVKFITPSNIFLRLQLSLTYSMTC